MNLRFDSSSTHPKPPVNVTEKDGNKEGTREAREKKAGRNGHKKRALMAVTLALRSATRLERRTLKDASAFLKTLSIPPRQDNNQPSWVVYTLPERVPVRTTFILLAFFYAHLFFSNPPLSFLTAAWSSTTPDEVVDKIIKLARKNLTPSQIGVTLRDSHGIPQVRFVTGNKILRILKSHGLGPSIPEDLWHLIKKAVAVRKHLKVNRKDKDSKFRLILIESRIHRLARYYKSKQQIPPTFKYDSATAFTLIA
ncbi:hypothetical protein K435DRAFT_857254 [Dendrothele bispora CBS 962.96]|uniref:Small ribosomal subunit protein uS15 N-terminal domain-containing protein n=1 Tax=Dendrothele bispora (strain CBS 962.96) TaxID=1314807 RepID=A0A4S8M6A0_DENBC|nr:hypothetical protein K435DRAFT_857254 [Dendrothele bispora CBS 962.96]